MIDWPLLKNLERDTALFSIFPAAAPLGEHLYAIGPNAYAATWHISHSKPGNGPFIVFTAWAASAGAAKRVLGDDLSADDGAISVPPDVLLLEPGCTNFASIQVLAETGRFGRFHISRPSAPPERRYRIAVGERLTYCFRDPSEPPFAITIDYRNIRWNLC